MASTTQRYPLSTADGKSIPLDVIRPLGLLFKTFTSVVSADIAVPGTCEIISFTATEDCIICFGSAASVPADGSLLSNGVFIPQNLRITVAPTAATFTVIRHTADGYVAVQFIDKWAGLALETQYSRR
jgi:hypothetical protein